MIGAKTPSGRSDIFSNKAVQIIGLGMAGAVIALAVWLIGWDSFWEAKTWDWRVRLLAKNGNASHEICLILLDQNSLDWGKTENSWSWPWPREVYGAIINFCNRSRVKSLAVDILFTEPSGYGVEDDVKLGSAMSEFGKAAGAVFIGQDKTTFPIPEVTNNARLLCNVRLLPDPDGVYRRMPLSFKENTVPSLGIGAYLAALPPHQDIQAALKKMEATVPKDPHGNAILRYRGTHTAYSAAAIIQSELRILSGEAPVISPDVLKDKYVFFKDECVEFNFNWLTKGLGIPKEEITFVEDVWAGGGNLGPSIEYFVRGLELGNMVFMQYKTFPDGSREELSIKIIDTGIGLE